MNYEGNTAKLPVHVVRGKGPNLFGCDWLQVIKLDWPKILHVSCPGSSHYIPILRRHEHVLGEEGTFTTAKAKIFVDQQVLQSDTKRHFWKARPLAYALRAKVEKELERQEAAGVIEPIQYSEWAAPVLVTAKADGRVRICDFLLTVNRFTRLDTYPIPRVEDLYAIIGDGEKFSKLDLSHAYHQVCLDDDSKKYVAIITHRGLYHYNRLPFGVNSACSIFQSGQGYPRFHDLSGWYLGDRP